MDDTLIGGYISLASVLNADSREVKKIILDKERQSRICSASYHYPEKAQYREIASFSKKRHIPVEYVGEKEFASLTNGEAYGGIAAYVGERRTLSPEELVKRGKYFLIIDGIEDPFNFGYVLRTAFACGCDGVLLPERNYFTSSNIVIRSSAGASELMRVAYYNDVEKVCDVLRGSGIRVACTAKTDDSVALSEYSPTSPICVVIGGEKRGINKALMAKADDVISIDYKNSYAMSLSASSAAAIIIYGVASRLK